MMIGTSLNSVIRADGSPKYSMVSMVSGAVINTILDPILIFVFKMGVEGAAIATIFAQFITFVMNVVYIRKFKSTKLNKNCFKFKGQVSRKILTLGISSFITQMSFVCVVTIQNNLFAKYGAMSKYGPEIPITVLGIVMKINQILNSMIIGVTTGAQPIFGYNYGARKFDRVKETLKRVLGISLAISITAFILFQTIPDKLIAIFGSGDELYMEFACKAFRTFLLLCICNGIQIPSGIFFQAIGKSSRSAVLSLSRQILFLIPSMFIFSNLYGVEGILYAGPVADLIAFILAVSFLIYEVKNLSKNSDKHDAIIDDTSTDNQLANHTIITVSREYGSGGRYVGRLIADILGIKLYDKDFTKMLSEKTGYAEGFIESNEEKRKSSDTFNSGYYGGLNNTDELFIKESELMKKVVKKDSCVIIGRCADFILRDRKDVIKIFIYSSLEDKIKRATKFYGVEKSKAEKEVRKINKERANHYKYYTEREWGNPENYDICINSDLLGVEKSAQLICDIIKEKEKENLKMA